MPDRCMKKITRRSSIVLQNKTTEMDDNEPSKTDADLDLSDLNSQELDESRVFLTRQQLKQRQRQKFKKTDNYILREDHKRAKAFINSESDCPFNDSENIYDASSNSDNVENAQVEIHNTHYPLITTSITVALPKNVVEEQKLEGFFKRKLKFLPTTTPGTIASLRPAKAPLTTKTSMFVTTRAKKNKTSASTAARKSLSPILLLPIPPTSTLTNLAEEDLPSLASTTTDASSSPDAAIPEPSSSLSVPLGGDETTATASKSSGEVDENDLDSFGNADKDLDESPSTTTTGQPAVPPDETELLHRQRATPPLPSLTTSTPSDLWWTPRPSYVGTEALSTISRSKKTNIIPVEPVRRKK
ncbi:hypothetical protein OSTOST_24352, partial [Ostertagia ostertagi]